MKTKLLILAIFVLTVSMKSDKPAYRFFDKKGNQTKYSHLLKDALNADIVFFGEHHDNPICHWLQLELTKDLFAKKGGNLILGAEMFETDNQLLLDEYIQNKISEKNFKNEAKLWPNYKTDYKPLVDFAKGNNLDFIATNIPRRYASIVYKKGFESLDSLKAEAKKLIAPLPIKFDPELKGYKEKLQMSGAMGGKKSHTADNLPKAQAIKDATMAYFILKNFTKGKQFLHYNGTYHSNNYEGIVWYILQGEPDMKIITISSVQQNDIKELNEEYLDMADYILCTPDNMTSTY